ncbi:MAG: prepilin-type N-terminal cleavage/methylation domain-containing protein [Fimbriimonas sp.]|nr:prepilin-type N-terminal cleavage/methylation domain-containing protein [Fimbriimonas sp.]
MRHARAFTLLELLVSVGIMAAITVGCVEALSVSLGFNEHLRSGRTTEQNRMLFEDRMTDLIQHIYIDPVNATSATTFFVGQTGMGMPLGQTVQPGETISATPTPTGTTTGGQVASPVSSGSSGGDADTLMFTAIGRKPSASALASTDDFETNNQNFGPQGGVSEFSVSLTPVGDPQGQTGLILRRQTPADQDATQGGYESMLEPDVTHISYEFFDGTNWDSTWDTFQQTGTRRLPNAVRVTYGLTGEANDRVFIVGIPLSDVTPANPATQTGGS